MVRVRGAGGRYTHQILEGLSYLHRHGIVHGDVHLCHMRIGFNGLVKLADYAMVRPSPPHPLQVLPPCPTPLCLVRLTTPFPRSVAAP